MSNLKGPYITTVIPRWFDERSNTLRTRATRDGYGRILRRLQQAHPEQRIEQFTPEQLEAFCRAGDPAPATIQHRRSALVSFFSWAQRVGLVPASPAVALKDDVRVTRTGVKHHHWLSEEQVRTLVRTCDDGLTGRRDHLAILLGVTTGLRASEIVAVRWGRIDLPGRTLEIVGKGQKPAVVGLPPQLADALEAWHATQRMGLGRPPSGEDPVLIRFRSLMAYEASQEPVLAPFWDVPLGTNGLTRLVRLRGAQAGWERLAPHDLRRTYAGLLEAKGVPIQEISKLLRHSNVGTTQRYLEDNPRKRLETAQTFVLDL